MLKAINKQHRHKHKIPPYDIKLTKFGILKKYPYLRGLTLMLHHSRDREQEEEKSNCLFHGNHLLTHIPTLCMTYPKARTKEEEKDEHKKGIMEINQKQGG